jgi:replicative DNA helicase
MSSSTDVIERQLLQSVLVSGDSNENSGACDEMLSALTASDFSTPERVAIFEMMRKLRETVSVDTGKIFGSFIENNAVLTELSAMMTVATSKDVTYLVNAVKEASIVREAKREALVFINELEGGNGATDAFKRVSDTFANLRIESSGSKQDFSPEKRTSNFLIELKDRTTSENEIRGLRTGLPTLDKASGGLHNGDLIVVGALPSMGKTSLALSIAAYTILNGGCPAIFSFEMERYALDANLIALITMMHPRMETVPKWVIENPKGHITSKQLNYIGEALTLVRESGTFIVDRSSHNRDMNFIRSMCYKRKADAKLNLIVTDYIGLMVENELQAKEEISGITGGHKKLACDLDVPAIILTQLNVRDGSKVTRPHMGMCKGSGSIEANADLVVFPWRQHVIDKEIPASEGVLFVDKSRAFGGGDIPLIFDTAAIGFQEADNVHEEERF